MTPLPHGAPQTLGEAFAHINALTAPTVRDLKVMVLLEATSRAPGVSPKSTSRGGRLRHTETSAPA